MPDCERLPGCVFFNDKMDQMPAMADIIKAKYCRGDKTNCARHLVLCALGKERVPRDLFPNQDARAKEIIDHAKSQP